MARLTASPTDPAWAYVQARTAAMNGDHARSAELLAALSQTMPNEKELARKALGAAIDSGRFDLALSLARQVDQASLPNDARLLIVGDELRRGRSDRALALLTANPDGTDLSFLRPLVTAWDLTGRNDLNGALATLKSIPANGPLSTFRDEETAFILLKFKRNVEAEAFARRAVGNAGPRDTQIRLALASGFLNAGDRARAQIMLDGISPDARSAAQRLLAGRLGNRAIDNGAEALSEVLTALAGDLARMQRAVPPLGLVQAARYANPDNRGATLLLALLLDIRERSEAALALLRTVPADDPLIGQARDSQVRILNGEKRHAEAYRVAAAAAASPGASAGDLSRLGDVYSAMDRHAEAADAYARAIALSDQQRRSENLWALYLLRAGALEEGNRWPEAKQTLERGLAIAPEQPLLLNFLGYAKLERGEDMDSAEAMIRKASQLAPDDASITDSLGWAQFKRGKKDEAIATLQDAAEKDPEQAEIQEHLGDALFSAGRRFEARFAWEAAMVTAEDEVAQRVRAKLQSGLTPGNAAP